MRSVPVWGTKTSLEKHILMFLHMRLLVLVAGQQNGKSHSCTDARYYSMARKTTECIYLGNAEATIRHVEPEVLGMCLCLPGRRENSGHQLLCSNEKSSRSWRYGAHRKSLLSWLLGQMWMCKKNWKYSLYRCKTCLLLSNITSIKT